MIRLEVRPAVTYSHIGGCREQIDEIRRTVEFSMIHHERLAILDIWPPKGVLLIGPPRSGKCLCARALANSTGSCYIKVVASELIQTCEGHPLSEMVRNLFTVARSREPCVILIDEIDVIAGAGFDLSVAGGHNELQKAVLELIYQLDNRELPGNIKVLMATNRPETLDPALIHPRRIERTVKFALPDLESRERIFRIYTSPMSIERGIRFDMLARLCPNTSVIDILSICTAAGKSAILDNSMVTENHFLEGVQKVINFYSNVSISPRYMTYNNHFHTI